MFQDTYMIFSTDCMYKFARIVVRATNQCCQSRALRLIFAKLCPLMFNMCTNVTKLASVASGVARRPTISQVRSPKAHITNKIFFVMIFLTSPTTARWKKTCQPPRHDQYGSWPRHHTSVPKSGSRPQEGSRL